MKIMIMDCYSKDVWYKNKIGKIYEVKKTFISSYLTKYGSVSKDDAVIV